MTLSNAVCSKRYLQQSIDRQKNHSDSLSLLFLLVLVFCAIPKTLIASTEMQQSIYPTNKITQADWITGTTQDAAVDPAPGTNTMNGPAATDLAYRQWVTVDPLQSTRHEHTTTRLQDGRLLVVGGAGMGIILSSVELFDPNPDVQSQWSTGSPLTTARQGHTATLLDDGQVLVVGGLGNGARLQSVERYDPDADKWHTVASLQIARSDHTATLLSDGRVLVIGGVGASESGGFGGGDSAEIYNPATNRWQQIAPMTVGRFNHRTLRLTQEGGRDLILVTGGQASLFEALDSVALYDVTANAWIDTIPLQQARYDHTMTLLNDGRIMVTGGRGNGADLDASLRSTTEIIDIAQVTAVLGQATQNIDQNVDQEIFSDSLEKTVESRMSRMRGMDLDTWHYVAPLRGARTGHTATLLSDGRLLLVGGLGAGGVLAEVLLYDPTIGDLGYWSTVATLNAARYNHTATYLVDGRVLIVGGFDDGVGNTLATVEEYAPRSTPPVGKWSLLAPVDKPRFLHTATLLSNGRLLVAGGLNDALRSTELFDVSSGVVGHWQPGPDMHQARYLHTATLIEPPDGLDATTSPVIVVGGIDEDSSPVSQVEYYHSDIGSDTGSDIDSDNSTNAFGKWTLLPALNKPRYRHTATLLQDGRLLVAGGFGLGGRLGHVEYYDTSQLVTRTHRAGSQDAGELGVWVEATPMNSVRDRHTATLLHDGRILVTGGRDASGLGLATAEIYDPQEDRWTTIDPMQDARQFHTATLLPDGRVLIIGGQNRGINLRSVEVYDPTVGTQGAWRQLMPMNAARYLHTATLLPNGHVMVVGNVGTTSSAEIFDIGANRWATTGPLRAPHDRHTATCLQDGRVVVIGAGFVTEPAVEVFDTTGNATQFVVLPEIDVFVTNDADQDSFFATKEEIALAPETYLYNLPVTFQVVITNYGPIDVKLIEIDNLTNGRAQNIANSSCAARVNDTLSPGESLTCTFETTVLADDALVLNNAIQVVAEADNSPFAIGQLAIDKRISVISTPDLQPQFSIEQLVDANGDGVFGDQEDAAIPLEDVTMQLRITNEGLEQLHLDQIVDYQGATIWGDDISFCATGSAATMSALSTLDAGESFTCFFRDFSPLKDAIRLPYTTTIVLHDDDGNVVTPKTATLVGTEDQKPRIDIWQPDPEQVQEIPSPNSEIACHVRVTNQNPYEPVTLIKLQQEVQVTPEEGSMTTVLQAEDTNTLCRMPRTIPVGETYSCTYYRYVEGMGGEQIACLVTVLAEDDDGNQTSIAKTTDIYTFISPTALPLMDEPVLENPNETYQLFMPFIVVDR
ncbi:MAG: kelch repeat-containing protein [Chloroflexota bacterium]